MKIASAYSLWSAQQSHYEAQAGIDLKVQGRDNTITQLRDHITSLQRKAEQSSQQAQGESLEIVLEHQLRVQFPFDVIEPVGKGEYGGDVLQHARGHNGQWCGKILWESKRTKAWADGWLTKLKTDQRAAHLTSPSSSRKPCRKMSCTSISSMAFGCRVWAASCRSPRLYV